MQQTRRLLLTIHAAQVDPPSCIVTDKVYSILLFLPICDLQKVPTSNTEGGWSFSLAEYIRHNDMPIYEASERVLRAFQDELMPAESLSEIFDVVGQYTDTSYRFYTS